MPARFLGFLFVVQSWPASLWSAPPPSPIATTIHDAAQGCRWRRFVKAVSAPRPGAAKRLELKFDDGRPYYVEATIDVRHTIDMKQGETFQQKTMTVFMKCSTAGVTQDGNGVLRMKIIGLKYRYRDKGSGVDFDSENIKFPDPETQPYNVFFGILRDADLVFAIDLGGKSVRCIDGFDKLSEELSDAIAANRGGLRSQVLDSPPSKEYLDQMVAPLFRFLPPQPVRPGDRWHRTDAFPSVPGIDHSNWSIRSSFTFDEKAGAYDRILIEQSVHRDEAKRQPASGLAIQLAEVRSASGKGEVLFDRARGRLVSMDLNKTMEGKHHIEGAGWRTEFSFHTRTRVRIRVTDRNPLEKKMKSILGTNGS